MILTAIDTREVVKELKAVGFSDDQAEAVTRVVRRSQDLDLSNLATKADIKDVRIDIETMRVSTKADIKDVRIELEALRVSAKSDLRETELRLEARIEAAKADTIKWMVGAIEFQTAIMIGGLITLLKSLAH